MERGYLLAEGPSGGSIERDGEEGGSYHMSNLVDLVLQESKYVQNIEDKVPI